MTSIKAALLAFICSGLSSCAIFIPQVKPKAIAEVDPVALTTCYLTVGATDTERTAANTELKSKTPQLNTNSRISLCWAYAYAEQWELAYLSAARQHSGTRQISGALAIPLAGGAVFRTATEDTVRRSTTGFIIGAAALYTASTYLTSLSREEVYLNGALAMECLQNASQPLLRATARAKVLESASNQLAASLLRFNGLIDGQKIDLSLVQNADLVVSRTNATNALKRAQDLDARIQGFAMALRNRIGIVSTQVAKLIKASEPSPQSMLSILSSFGSIAGGLQAGFTIPKPDTTKGGDKAAGVTQSGRGDLDAAQKDLEAKTAEVVQELSGISAVAEKAENDARDQDCTPAGPKTSFTVSPDAASLVVAAGATLKITVTTSDGFPGTATVEGNDGEFIKVDPYSINTGAINSDQFVLTVHGINPTDKASPVIKITDHANEVRKTFAISVTAAQKKAEEPKKPDPDSKPKPEPATPDEVALLGASTLKPGELQCVVDAPVDCTIGTQTRDAIEKYRKTKSLAQSRAIDQKLVLAVQADLDAGKAACKNKDATACK